MGRKHIFELWKQIILVLRWLSGALSYTTPFPTNPTPVHQHDALPNFLCSLLQVPTKRAVIRAGVVPGSWPLLQGSVLKLQVGLWVALDVVFLNIRLCSQDQLLGLCHPYGTYHAIYRNMIQSGKNGMGCYWFLTSTRCLFLNPEAEALEAHLDQRAAPHQELCETSLKSVFCGLFLWMSLSG